MGRTFLDQEVQIRSSRAFDDTLPSGITMENTGSNLQQDLNNIRSQIKRILASGSGAWTDDLPTTNGKQRGLSEFNIDLDDIEEKRILFRTQILTDVFVSASSNVATLSGNEKPTEVFASGSTDTTGALAVYLNQTDTYGSHSLVETPGFNAVAPKNLVIIRSSSTGDPVFSGGREVKGLLQIDSGAVDGTAFNDTTQRPQISFVRENTDGDDLEAVPVGDIENHTINYSYVRRIDFDNIPEQAFLDGRFVDQVAAVDVNLNNAIDNQVGLATQDQDIDWDISDGNELAFTADSGGTNMLLFAPTGGGNEVEFNVDTFDVNNANDADFLNGASFDTGGTTINVGVSAGQVDSVSALTMSSGVGFDTKIIGSNELFLDDGNQTGWTQTDGIKLSNTSADWTDFSSTFGEISILEAIVSGSNTRGHKKAYGEITQNNVSADTNIRGGVNLDAFLLNYDGLTFVDDVNVYVNGMLMRNGADATDNHDVYPGDDATQGDLKFEFKLKEKDIITMEIFI